MYTKIYPRRSTFRTRAIVTVNRDNCEKHIEIGPIIYLLDATAYYNYTTLVAA